MKDPGLPTQIVLSVAQWSLDHRVFTLSLLRRGAVHRRHVEMLNRYYTLMHLMSTTREVCLYIFRLDEANGSVDVGRRLVAPKAERCRPASSATTQDTILP